LEFSNANALRFDPNINGRESGPDQLKSLTKSSVGLDMTKEACPPNLSHH